MEKYLYFRTVADEANDGVTGLKTNNPSSFLFPANTLTAIQPTGDGALTLYFEPALAEGSVRDSVVLNVTEGDHFEVMEAITSAIANPARGHNNGFIVIADDVVTTDSATSSLNDLVVPAEYIHPSITSCGAITVNNPSNGFGVHEYYEVLDVGAVGSGDSAGELGISIPAGCVIQELAGTVVEKAASNHGAVAVYAHSSSINLDASASATTEILGAGASTGSVEQKPVYTITFAGALVTSNTFDMNVNGVALTQETFNTNSNTTMANIAAELQALSSIESAVVTDAGGGTDDDRVITVTGALEGVAVDLDDLVVAAGASQTTAAVAITTLPMTAGGCVPAVDLDCDNAAGTVGKSVVYTGDAIDRTSAATFIGLEAQEALTSMTGTPKVGVYVKWVGNPAVVHAQA